MNVLFIYSLNDVESRKKPVQKPEDIQLGISYISALLKKHHHTTKLLVVSRILDKKNRNLINNYIEEFKPGLICFTAIATEYQSAVKIARFIKTTYPHIFLIIGGPHATLKPEEVIKDTFDALCIAEGEYPVLELVHRLENAKPVSAIPNLWIKKGDMIEKNPARSFLQDIDNLPFPDRDMWLEWIENNTMRHAVLLGRGCPFQCTYCSNHGLRKAAPGTYVRFRSPENILAEIREIVHHYMSCREIYLEVETIGLNKEWAIELCSKLEAYNNELDDPISYGVNLRVTRHADFKDIFLALKKSNFKFITIGLESGSERVRHDILKRNYSNADIINTVKLARTYGLKIVLNNIIGIPGETIEDFQETVRINRICRPDHTNTFIFMPYPGTGLYETCRKMGLLKGKLDTEMERRKATLDLPGFSRKQIQKSFIWFEYYIYRGYKPLYKILARVIRSKLQSRYSLNTLYRVLSRSGIMKKLIKRLRGF
ncbi:MAG: B12-binding domain-containing radical SAM protein [Spirochaetales bacterium]|nr:B12-binding domain-containing radical SAM protein [Spirochaetales bacterium]